MPVEDLTGGGDHFRAEVVSDRFQGLSLIEQHRLVYDVFGPEIGGAIHALSIKTSTPGGTTMNNDEIRDVSPDCDRREPGDALHEGHAGRAPCGFSMRTSGALNALGVRYAAIDILPDPRIREELSALSGWPTIPQLFVDGKLVGGCDIVMEMYESGELAETLGVEQPAEEPSRRPRRRRCPSRGRSASRIGSASRRRP